MELLITIITPCYNAQQFLKETAESVFTQTYSNFEWIIIDDCSTDNTWDLLTELSNLDPRIKLFKNEKNSGVAFSRNRGIENSSGAYIAFLDADDIWFSTKLEQQMDMLLKSDSSFCFTAYKIINENGSYKKTYHIPLTLDFNEMLNGSVVCLSSTLLNKKAIGDIRFQNIFHEDYIFFIDLLRKKNAVGLNQPLVAYRKHSNSISKNKFNASLKQFQIYRNYLNMNIWETLPHFISYVFKGIKKHFF